MEPINIRMPAELVAALRQQAEQRGLRLAQHVRSQLAAALVRPHDVTKTAGATR